MGAKHCFNLTDVDNYKSSDVKAHRHRSHDFSIHRPDNHLRGNTGTGTLPGTEPPASPPPRQALAWTKTTAKLITDEQQPRAPITFCFFLQNKERSHCPPTPGSAETPSKTRNPYKQRTDKPAYCCSPTHRIRRPRPARRTSVSRCCPNPDSPHLTSAPSLR